jgi:hypothetical protein
LAHACDDKDAGNRDAGTLKLFGLSSEWRIKTMGSRVFYTENKFVFLFSFKFSCLPMLRPICLALAFLGWRGYLYIDSLVFSFHLFQIELFRIYIYMDLLHGVSI